MTVALPVGAPGPAGPAANPRPFAVPPSTIPPQLPAVVSQVTPLPAHAAAHGGPPDAGMAPQEEALPRESPAVPPDVAPVGPHVPVVPAEPPPPTRRPHGAAVPREAGGSRGRSLRPGRGR